MKILTRYLVRIVTIDTLLVLFALVALQSLFAFQDETGNVGKGTYSFQDALYYILLQVPTSLYELFPVSALIGGLVSMGRLASHSELIVMRASGVSLKQMSMMVLQATLGLMLLVVLIGEFIAPESAKLARQMKTSAISGGNLIKSEQGVWLKDGSRFVQINMILPSGRLEGINVFEFEGTELKVITLAEAAEQNANGQWELIGVKQSFIGEEQVNHTRADVMLWRTEINQETLGVVSLQPEDLNLKGLSDYADYLESNQLDATRYHLTFWQKLFQPLSVIVMMFLALSFISGPLRTVSMGSRILMGLITGVGFSLLVRLFGPMSLVYQLPPVIAAILPILLFSGLAILLMSRAR